MPQCGQSGEPAGLGPGSATRGAFGAGAFQSVVAICV